jgi:hypothetical protein
MNTGINGSSIFNMLSDLFLLPFHCCVFFEILLVNRTVRMEGYSEDYCVLLSLLVPSEIDSSPKNTKNSFRKQSQRMASYAAVECMLSGFGFCKCSPIPVSIKKNARFLLLITFCIIILQLGTAFLPRLPMHGACQ